MYYVHIYIFKGLWAYRFASTRVKVQALLGLLGPPGARILSNHTPLYGAISAGGPIVAFSCYLSTSPGFLDLVSFEEWRVGAMPGHCFEPWLFEPFWFALAVLQDTPLYPLKIEKAT